MKKLLNSSSLLIGLILVFIAVLTNRKTINRSTENAIAESRRETNALYNICGELARNTSELARDRAVMYEILRGLNEDRVRTAENVSILAEQSSRQNQLLERIADALENRN